MKVHYQLMTAFFIVKILLSFQGKNDVIMKYNSKELITEWNNVTNFYTYQIESTFHNFHVRTIIMSITVAKFNVTSVCMNQFFINCLMHDTDTEID